MLEERLKELEIKFAYQDQFIGELNKIVTEQQGLLEKIQRELLEMKLALSDSPVSPNRTLADDVPPHY